MKKYILLPLLLLASGLFAQKDHSLTADKDAPVLDPSQLQGPIDTIPPTITCLSGISVDFDQTGLFAIQASDFLQSVSDNQTPGWHIKLGVRIAGTGAGFPVDTNGNPVSSLLFDCSAQSGNYNIELWAMDGAGNTAYCETSFQIDDTFGYCDPNNYDSVLVCVRLGCNGEPMPGLPVHLYSSSNFIPPFIAIDSTHTDENGCITLHYFHDSHFTIAPEKDDDPLNGVNTYDLLLIAKHILGIQPLDNPYKLIAADANKSGSITTFDLIELRKLIMGIYSELPNNVSWRFIDGDFEFPNPANPFQTAFPELISLDDSQMLDSIALVGVKIGDVDCSASPVPGAPIDYPDAFLAMPDTVLLAGNEYDIPLFMAENSTWQGYQFGLNINNQQIEVLGMDFHDQTSAGNWNNLLVSAGKLTTSWWDISGLSVAFGPNLPIVTFHVKALSNVVLKDAVSIDAQAIRAEGYIGNNGDKRDLLLTFLPMFKPTPNPLADKTDPGPDPTQLGDFEPPSISCLNGVSLNILPTNSVNLFALDLLESVHDNATPNNQIKIGMRRVGDGIGFPNDNAGNAINSLFFDCDEVGTLVAVELWAMDLAGNTAYCVSDVLITDNLGFCGGGNSIVFTVCAQSACSGEMMQDVTFNVFGTVNFAPPFSYFDLSDTSGCYTAYNSVPIASTFSIRPEKDDNPLNGVTTFDLTLLSKHIHGVELLTEPWQWVAADVNRDGLITLEDSVELSKLIQGVYTSFPNNTSWRFVPSGYQFPSPNPLSVPPADSITIENILSGFDTVFLSIKIGDLNCTAVPNFKPTVNPSADKTSPGADPTQLGDFEPPSIVCSTNPAYLEVTSGQNATIGAWDLIQSLHDNASTNAQIKLSMRLAGTGSGFPVDAQGNPTPMLEFGCNDLGERTVEVWAKDAAGNTAQCESLVIPHTSLWGCPPGAGSGLPIIYVKVRTEANEGLEEMQFDISGSNPNQPFFVNTYCDFGNYCGYFGVPPGSNVSVAPLKDDNPLNGVTTFDKVLIYRHIQGIEKLNSPYKIIAADVDRNGVIDSTDVEELEKLILGVYTELPNNTSWRFVPQDFTFPDAQNPFASPFPENVTVLNIQNSLQANFVAIKVGDVNNTAVGGNFLQPVPQRSDNSAQLLASFGQIQPNPTSGAAYLPLALPAADMLQLELFDLSGRVLWKNTAWLDEGPHRIEIPASALPEAGMYVWQARVGNCIEMGKLIRY